MIIIRYGEIGIKGQNRPLFEKKLVENIKAFLKEENIPYKAIKRLRGRIEIITDQEVRGLERVFGISSYSNAITTPLSLEEIKETALKILRGNTFKIETKRLQKTIPLTSPEINREIGKYLEEKTGKKAEYKDPEQTIYIEVMKDHANIFDHKKKGKGGLPLGIEGRSILILEREEDLLAGLLMMKRGCSLTIISEDEKLIRMIRKYHYGEPLKIIRREEIKDQEEESIIVSQTLEEIDMKIEEETKKVVFRPLIAMTKEEIRKKLEEYYESIP